MSKNCGHKWILRASCRTYTVYYKFTLISCGWFHRELSYWGACAVPRQIYSPSMRNGIKIVNSPRTVLQFVAMWTQTVLWLVCNSTRLNIYWDFDVYYVIFHWKSVWVDLLRYSKVLWIVNSDVMHFIRKQTFLMVLTFDPRANFRYISRCYILVTAFQSVDFRLLI